MRAWAVLRLLTWDQRWTLVVAALLLPVCAVLLRCTSLARLLAPVRGPATPRPGALADALAAARAVNLVAARGRATCLTRSLTLHWILARRGIGTMLRVGVRNRGDGGLHAHAWVECDGVPVNDSTHGVQGFARLDLA